MDFVLLEMFVAHAIHHQLSFLFPRLLIEACLGVNIENPPLTVKDSDIINSELSRVFLG